MVDIETLGTDTNSVILSIAAAAFNPVSGYICESTFSRNIDIGYQLDMGSVIDTKTLYWWLGQSDEARQGITDVKKESIESVLKVFNKWIDSIPGSNKRLWGNGATFDNAIIRQAYKKYKINFDIPFWNDRDVRTIVGFYPPQLFKKWKEENPRKGGHIALEDVKYQIYYVTHILRELGVKEIW